MAFTPRAAILVSDGGRGPFLLMSQFNNLLRDAIGEDGHPHDGSEFGGAPVQRIQSGEEATIEADPPDGDGFIALSSDAIVVGHSDEWHCIGALAASVPIPYQDIIASDFVISGLDEEHDTTTIEAATGYIMCDGRRSVIAPMHSAATVTNTGSAHTEYMYASRAGGTVLALAAGGAGTIPLYEVAVSAGGEITAVTDVRVLYLDFNRRIAITTEDGQTIIGPLSANFFHFYTELPMFYFDKVIVSDEGLGALTGTDMVLYTGCTSGGVKTEKARLTADGLLGIGAGATPLAMIHAKQADTDGIVWIINQNPREDASITGYGAGVKLGLGDLTGGNDPNKWAGIAAVQVGASNADIELAFYTQDNISNPPVEVMRINKGGTVIVKNQASTAGLRIQETKTPSGPTDTGTKGDICWDEDRIYVCVATNSWKCAALSTW